MTRFPELVGAMLALVVSLLAFGDFGAAQPSRAAEPPRFEWSADEVALARHTVNERGFRAVDDGLYIASIHMRAAASHGVSARRDRRWVAFLDGSLEAPIDWPELDVPWGERGRALWLATLEEARHSLANPPRTCGGRYPSTWGGSVDSDRIARMTGPRGAYVRLACPNTANTFLARRE